MSNSTLSKAHPNYLTIYLPKECPLSRIEIEQQARGENRSTSNFVVTALIEYIKNKDGENGQ